MIRHTQPPAATQPAQGPPPLQLPTPPQNTPQPVNAAMVQLRKAIDKGTLGTKGKEYTGPLKVFCNAGKLFPCVIDPWLGIDGVFTCGMTADGLLTVDAEEEEESNAEVAEQRKVLQARQENAYKHMLRLVPNFQSIIKSLCDSMDDNQDYESSSLPKLFKIITEAAQQGREADTTKLKGITVELLQQLKLIAPSGSLPFQKSQWGFNYFNMGRLLCPAKIIDDYDDALLVKLKDGTVEVTANDILFFMYDNTRDDEDIYQGLCQGEFLICSLRHMLFGSAITQDNKHATKLPIACKFDFKDITPPMIAYAATQARFVLSDVSQWGMQDGLFDYQQFFYNILELFERPDDEWTKATLAFWNKSFFSESGIIRIKRKKPPPPPAPNSNKLRLKWIRDERYQAQQLAVEVAAVAAAALTDDLPLAGNRHS